MKLLIALDDPHQWALLDRKNRITNSALSPGLESLPPLQKVEEVIGIVAGESVLIRELEVPGNRRSNVEAAIPYALEEELTEDVEALHFTLLEWSAGKPATVAIIARDYLDRKIRDFADAGLQLDAVIPEFLILPQHEKSELTIARLDQDRFYIRSGDVMALALDADSFEFWWQSLDRQQTMAVNDVELARQLIHDGGQSVNHWEIGTDFPAWLTQVPLPNGLPGVSLLQGDYFPRHRKSKNRASKLAVMVGMIAFLVWWGSLTVEYQRLKKEITEATINTYELFARTFPDDLIVDDLSRVKNQVAALINRASSGSDEKSDFTVLLDSVSRVMPKLRAVVEEVSYRDRTMIVACLVPNLATLDKLKTTLNSESGISASLISSGSRDKKVSGRFRLKRQG